jgi:hypothetical protein
MWKDFVKKLIDSIYKFGYFGVTRRGARFRQTFYDLNVNVELETL